MHGTMPMLNRKGRKRKSGRRTPSGAVARRDPVDYRSMAALQPHRIRLPEALRSDEKAESVLGCLNLIYRISKRTAANRPGITDEQYEAGRRYSVLVGAYLAHVGAPRSTAGSGSGSHACPTGACEKCKAITDQYMRAHEAIGKKCTGIPRIARETHQAVNWVVIDDNLCNAEQLEWLKRGLSALARHFGLTNQRKS
jgi:hypothetical protein